jgi:DNA mismatch repair protein MutS
MKLTPLMQQYWAIKQQHLDKLLLFRMGDFYELFNEDAVIAAPILNIALTARNKKAQDETPMCGVPHHSVAGPIGKLLQAGYKVALCEQLEDPAVAKGLVKRGVTRILSPGMVYDPDTLDLREQNFLAAFDHAGVYFLDASTGATLAVKTAEPAKVFDALRLLQPTEVVMTKAQNDAFPRSELPSFHLTEFDDLVRDWPAPFEKLSEGAQRLLTYVVHMQGPGILSALRPFESDLTARRTLFIRDSAFRHLEVFAASDGRVEGSLFHAMDRTKTTAGARRFKSWLKFPLRNRDQILDRQKKVAAWMKNPHELKVLREKLGRLGDLERRIGKLHYPSCGPRDLMSLADALEVAAELGGEVAGAGPAGGVARELRRALVDDPPVHLRQGGVIRAGYRSHFDELVAKADGATTLLAELESRERATTGISSLKVRYNGVFGYFIEVTQTHLAKVPDRFERKQTLANAERFTTPELRALEAEVLSAQARRLEMEQEIFLGLKADLQKNLRGLLLLADELSELDVVSALAWLAIEQNYVLPEFSDSEFVLEASRHPSVESSRSTFIPNDVSLGSGETLILTGPNMAGKSTLMRQVALTVLLTQVGAPVPCRKARLPIFDSLLTRVGASDHLAAGLSTFMVEMKECAEILNAIDGRTLVIMDEVGRGTSTYDGMSIAEAILESLMVRPQVVTLFATHYHELTRLARDSDGAPHARVRNVHMAIEDNGGDITFLYRLKDGPGHRSYGLHVAELAGLPASVLKRAGELLKAHLEGSPAPVTEPSPLSAQPTADPVLMELLALDLSRLTPIEALNKLHQWQNQWQNQWQSRPRQFELF